MKRAVTVLALASTAALGYAATGALGYAATRATPAQGMVPVTKFHEQLARDVGVWDGSGEMRMPGAPEPMPFEGTETIEMVGRLWIVSDFESAFMGMPFQGRSTLGYDPGKGKFVGTWVDSMNPTLTVMEGDLDEETGAIEMRYTTTRMGMEIKVHTVHSHADDDTREYRSYTVADDGSESLSMKITYRRRKP